MTKRRQSDDDYMEIEMEHFSNIFLSILFLHS